MQENEDTTPTVYQPSSSSLQAPTPLATTCHSNVNTVTMQPMSEQQAGGLQAMDRPKSNDYFYLTASLMFLCLLTCNHLGALCLMPALICASMVRAIQLISCVEIIRALYS